MRVYAKCRPSPLTVLKCQSTLVKRNWIKYFGKGHAKYIVVLKKMLFPVYMTKYNIIQWYKWGKIIYCINNTESEENTSNISEYLKVNVERNTWLK